MSKAALKDPRIRLRPSKTLLTLIVKHKDCVNEIPANIAMLVKRYGHGEIFEAETTALKAPYINTELRKICRNSKEELKEVNNTTSTEEKEEEIPEDPELAYLYLSDLRWIHCLLRKLRKEQGLNVYLHDVIDGCGPKLPKDEIIKRYSELKARCQRLREEQQNRDNRKMTKDVNAVAKHYPKHTNGYQIKSINSQIIAVLQFVSVVAGFYLGFLAVELIVGNLDVDFLLFLGIMCALIMALAYKYF